jgi:hypothetical protein
MNTRRPNPRQALASILAAPDHAAALERTRHQLERAWAAGHQVGWRAGVADANDDAPPRNRRNPYRKADR